MGYNRKIQLTILIAILLLPTVLAVEPAFTFKQDKAVNLCIPVFNANNSEATAATTCFLTLKNPLMQVMVTDEIMTFDSEGLFCYDINSSFLNMTGNYPTTMRCNSTIDNSFSNFITEITPTGKVTSDGIPFISMGLFLLVFGVSGFFLILFIKINSPPIKLFFLLASFVFLIGSLVLAMVIGFSSGLPAEITSSITYIMYAVGIIFTVIFAFVLINQIISSMDMLRQRKGYEPNF